MNFNSLYNRINSLTENIESNVAVHISTSEGDIKIKEKKQLKAASVIKLPIIMTGFHEYEKGNLDIFARYKISNTTGGSGVLHYLTSFKGHLKVINLMELAMIVSDNSASNMLIDLIGKNKINNFIKKMNIDKTELNRHFMDDESANKGIDNYTSAFDMTLLMKLLHSNSRYLTGNSRKAIIKMLNNQQFRGKLAAHQSMFDNDITVANKTGELNKLEHDVGFFSRGKKVVYCSVLTSDINNNEGQRLISNIGNQIFNYMKL